MRHIGLPDVRGGVVAYGLTQFQAVARYLALAVWPHRLVFEYGPFWVTRPGEIVPYALFVIPLAVATVWALVKRPILGFLGLWFFAILAPTSLVPGTLQMIVEHRMYLPLAAVTVAAAAAVQAWLGPRNGLFLLLALAAASLGAGTARRNAVYRTELTLWADTVAKRPDNPFALYGLGVVHGAGGSVRTRRCETTRGRCRFRPNGCCPMRTRLAAAPGQQGAPLSRRVGCRRLWRSSRLRSSCGPVRCRPCA